MTASPLHPLALLLLAGAALAPAASYTVGGVGNSENSLEGYVQNCAHSIWAAPDGTVYAASIWDEKGRSIGAYKDGRTVGAMGGVAGERGSAIGGDAKWLFVAMSKPVGAVGRFDRATGQRTLTFPVAAGSDKIDLVRGIAVAGNEVYATDLPGNKVRVFSQDGAPLRSWDVPSPGAIAAERDGKAVWVAQPEAGTVSRFSASGQPGAVIQLGAGGKPTALHVDAQNRLWVGDQGPDLNIKIYRDLSGTPALDSTFGVTGGCLSTEGGALKGQAGPKRFARIMGIGTDDAGNVYVLSNPFGGTSDVGRDGMTDLQAFDAAGNPTWMRQQLVFEGNGAPDPGTDGADLYGGTILYTTAGGFGPAGYKANTVDPFRYPADARIDTQTKDRGRFFGHVASVGGKRVLVACGQNPDTFYSYYFHPETDGYVAIPGQVFGGQRQEVRHGFCLDTRGDVWTGANQDNKPGFIQHYALQGFGDDGKPQWAEPETTPVPASIGGPAGDLLDRLEYVADTDTMVLADHPANSWVVMGKRAEIYKGWKAGNRTPTATVDLGRAVAKSMSAAGDYLFVGYYAIPDVDVFELATGKKILTMTTDANVAYTGNDTDSMYSIKAYRRKDGAYLVTKDDYNANKIVLYTFVP